VNNPNPGNAVTVSAAELQAILTRLRRLEDDAAIVATLQRLSTAADHGTADDWLQWFEGDDATLEIQGPRPLLHKFMARGPEETASGVRFAGRRALARFINGRNMDPAREQKHHTTYASIDVDGDRAHTRCYFLCTVNSHGEMSIEAMGRYVDRLVRCRDGVWRLTHRLILAGPVPG
jgi:hypothetical protein